MRLVEQIKEKNDVGPKALACYGMLIRSWNKDDAEQEKALLRFVSGRPVSTISTQYLEWACQKISEMGKKVLVLVWDNASWHVSGIVRNWIHAHNRQVKQSGSWRSYSAVFPACQKTMAASN